MNFTMSFGGVDFCLTPTNRQSSISFRPSFHDDDNNDDDDDEQLVLQLDSFTGTLRIGGSRQRSQTLSQSATNAVFSPRANNSQRGTNRITTTDPVTPATYSNAPANVSPNMGTQRSSNLQKKSTHSTTKGETTAAHAVVQSRQSPTTVSDHCSVESVRMKEDLPSTIVPTINNNNKRDQDCMSSTIFENNHTIPTAASLAKRTRRCSPQALNTTRENEVQQQQRPLSSTTASSCHDDFADTASTTNHLIYLGQTPDLSQPSIATAEEMLMMEIRNIRWNESGNGDEVPLLLDSDPGAGAATSFQTPSTTNTTTRATVQELLNMASDNTTPQDDNDEESKDDDDEYYNNHDEEERETPNTDIALPDEDADDDDDSTKVMETEVTKYDGDDDNTKAMETEATKDNDFTGESYICHPSSDMPLPRWGHTMTKIGDNRILIYGGQAFESSSLLTTLSDVQMYDLAQRTWHQPVNCDGVPRQWHSATYLPNRQLLISFGGESFDTKLKKLVTHDQVMVLDTEIMLWYPPTVTGTAPSGRSGHTATLFNNGNDLVVFGGVKGAKWLNSVSVLDTMRWRWSAPKISGSAPKPRSYHTATAIVSTSGKKNRLVIIGGNNAGSSFNSVHVLENEGKSWRWIHPTVWGTGPSPRTGHSATLLDDQKTILVYGGWDVNASDEDTIFGDSFLLDTESWLWLQGPTPNFVAASNGDMLKDSEKRVGHTAVLIQGQEEPEILVFGGRLPNDQFCNDFQRMQMPRQMVGREE